MELREIVDQPYTAVAISNSQWVSDKFFGGEACVAVAIPNIKNKVKQKINHVTAHMRKSCSWRTAPNDPPLILFF
jgi:uncharacterized protein YjdB